MLFDYLGENTLLEKSGIHEWKSWTWGTGKKEGWNRWVKGKWRVAWI